MTTGNKLWTLIIIILVAIIAAGSLVAWSRYTPDQPVEISIPQTQQWQGEIYIEGAVAMPGLYPLKEGDSLAILIQAAGGTTASADLSGVKLYISETGRIQPQRIDINRAEAWLLEALPGIGKTLAQRVVDYRQQHGPFRNTNELLKVAGVGVKTYEQIKDLITVAD